MDTRYKILYIHIPRSPSARSFFSDRSSFLKDNRPWKPDVRFEIYSRHTPTLVITAFTLLPTGRDFNLLFRISRGSSFPFCKWCSVFDGTVTGGGICYDSVVWMLRVLGILYENTSIAFLPSFRFNVTDNLREMERKLKSRLDVRDSIPQKSLYRLKSW